MRSRQAALEIHHILAAGLILLTLLASCSPFLPQPTTQPASLTPRESPSATTDATFPAPTATTTPGTPTVSPTPTCTSRLGQVQQVELSSERMYEPFKMSIYLPPCYNLYADRHYPSLYLFHGIYYSNDQWVRLGVTRVVDALISKGEILPFILIMPYDPNGREPTETMFDEVFMDEALPYVDAHFRTIPSADFRAVGGLSRGAGWALHFGLTHPELFGAIGAHSPIIFWEDAPKIGTWLDAIPRSEMPRFYLDIGDQDPNNASADLLEGILQDHNIPFEQHLNSGFHTEAYWSQHVEDYLRWYVAGW